MPTQTFLVKIDSERIQETRDYWNCHADDIFHEPEYSDSDIIREFFMAAEGRYGLDELDFRHCVEVKEAKDLADLFQDILHEFGHKEQVLLSTDRVREWLNIISAK